MVAENYLDARGGGFDPAAWDALCQRVLSGPLRDRAAAHRCALQGFGRAQRMGLCHCPETRGAAALTLLPTTRCASACCPGHCATASPRICALPRDLGLKIYK